MDSGLLIVSSVEPVASGFVAFTSVGVEGMVRRRAPSARQPITRATYSRVRTRPLEHVHAQANKGLLWACLLYTSPSPRDS